MLSAGLFSQPQLLWTVHTDERGSREHLADILEAGEWRLEALNAATPIEEQVVPSPSRPSAPPWPVTGHQVARARQREHNARSQVGFDAPRDSVHAGPLCRAHEAAYPAMFASRRPTGAQRPGDLHWCFEGLAEPGDEIAADRGRLTCSIRENWLSLVPTSAAG